MLWCSKLRARHASQLWPSKALIHTVDGGRCLTAASNIAANKHVRTECVPRTDCSYIGCHDGQRWAKFELGKIAAWIAVLVGAFRRNFHQVRTARNHTPTVR